MNERGNIHRSRDEQMIAGVCGGLAEWLDLDPSIVRLIFILMALTFGHGILVYLVLALVMPLEK
jgi:phage shock protein C